MKSIDVEGFVADGFAKVESVVPREVGDQARELLWRQIGLSPDEPSAWREPVVWACDNTGEGPFGGIIRSPRLHAALDAVAGAGRWLPRPTAGMVPIRFPNVPPADDRGWHIDLNTVRPDGSWGVSGRPETLLLLLLFSEVGQDDAPTRIRAGSQRDVAGLLGEQVEDVFALGPQLDEVSRDRPLAWATGQPGDAFVVHPLTVHAADQHFGTRPRFMAQLPIQLAKPFAPDEDTLLGRAVRDR
ncbi:phytanoyl-CoA dioxygenase [Nonomuraea sp. NPDC000554]|uniref:phytanoyl-CoA dioxygenase n=1 Tax=Nonomuraea sp. NPDC000554 TaxID=3154259 RepID=UPI00332DEFB9